MMNEAIAVDTNVLIYLHDEVEHRKQDIASSILTENPKISAQIVSEYLNVCRKILSFTKDDLLLHTADLFRDCEIVNTTPSTLRLAASLVKKYRFQLFDSIIVASSLEIGCSTLYSEDMQDDLVVNESLRIINSFR